MLGLVSRWHVVAILLSTQALASLDGHCPPLGAVLPAPRHPSTDETVKSAVEALEIALESTISALNGSGVAIGVKSIHESNLLLEYMHTPSEYDPRGVSRIDGDTVFRLASMSKLFPVLAVLKLHNVDLNDAVTKYLPELHDLNKQARAQNPIWTVDWDDITLGALASHLGGIPADMATDLQPYGDWTQLGFPPDDVSRNLNCSGLFGLKGCADSVFDERFGQRPPVYLPYSSNTVYSNIGWTLLGRVIEKVSGIPSGDYIKDNIWEPLGMKHTFAEKPDDALGFIPAGDGFWNATLGFEAPGGEYYSSINDVLAFGDAILLNKVLSPAKTRKWLKPVTGTASPGIFVGQPWEIFRTSNVTKDGRIIEFYAKGGDLITYHSILVLIPDYDIVVAVLGAGPQVSGGVIQLLFSSVVEALLPAIEEAGKAESELSYAGTYTDSETNSTLTLSLDDSPGFSVTNWTVRGVNIIDTFLSINLPPQFPTPPGLVRFRLYPTTISTGTQSSWRAVPAAGTAEDNEAAEAQFVWPGATCNTWASVDRLVYQLLSQDHFVFTETEGSGGKAATELELVGYGVTLKRQ